MGGNNLTKIKTQDIKLKMKKKEILNNNKKTNISLEE